MNWPAFSREHDEIVAFDGDPLNRRGKKRAGPLRPRSEKASICYQVTLTVVLSLAS